MVDCLKSTIVIVATLITTITNVFDNNMNGTRVTRRAIIAIAITLRLNPGGIDTSSAT